MNVRLGGPASYWDGLELIVLLLQVTLSLLSACYMPFYYVGHFMLYFFISVIQHGSVVFAVLIESLLFCLSNRIIH